MAKILLIDDDPLVLDSVRLVLGSAGHVVVAVSDGRTALDHVEDPALDAVVTDIIMPEPEGIETIIEVRRRAPNLPIIAISGGARLGNTELLQMAEKLGASASLRKPFRPNELLAVVERLTGRGEGR